MAECFFPSGNWCVTHGRYGCTGPTTMADCVFCRIVLNVAPAQRVAESGDTIGIVPLNPVVHGHVLFIPKVHVSDALYRPQVAGVVMRQACAYAADRPELYRACNLITSVGEDATQSVMHYHLHLVPRRAGDLIRLPWTGQSAKPCCEGPHVRPCRNIDPDQFYCACGCAGDDSRCWLEKESS